MAARLMGKAMHGILIDEATFCRLPSSVAASVKKLPAIVVKGKTDAIQVYSAASDVDLEREANDSTQLVDYLIRGYHVHKLMSILNDVAPIARSMAGLSRSLSRLFAVEELENPSMSSVYVEGKVGSGISSLMKWFEREVIPRNVPFVNILLTESDRMLDFRALVLIFHSLMGKEAIDHKQGEDEAISALLEDMHADDDNDINFKHTLAVMHFALGVTTKLERNKNRVRRKKSKRGFLNQTLWTKKTQDKVVKLTEENINSGLIAIFQHIICQASMVILLGRIHFVDDRSLAVLKHFMDFPTKSLIVFTAVPFEHIGRKTSNAAAANNNGDHLRLIHELHQKLIYNKGVQIDVKAYTIEDIEAILCSVLNCNSTPIGLAELVHQLSSGAAFWVKEVVEFVRQTGADEFLEIMNKNNKLSSTVKSRLSKTATTFSDDERSSGSPTNKKSNRMFRMMTFSVGAFLSGSSSPSATTQNRWKVAKEASVDSNSVSVRSVSAAVTKSKLDTFVICILERMHPDCKKIVKVASVLGPEFSEDILRGILSEGLQNELDGAIAKLIQFNLLVRNTDDPKDLYFAQDFIYTTVSDLVPLSEKIGYSVKITEFVVQKYSNEQTGRQTSVIVGKKGLPVKYCVLLSEHYHLSKQDDKALEVCCKKIVALAMEEHIDGLHCKEILKSASKYCMTATNTELVVDILDYVVTSLHQQHSKMLRSRDYIAAGKSVEVEKATTGIARLANSLSCISGSPVTVGVDNSATEGHAYAAPATTTTTTTTTTTAAIGGSKDIKVRSSDSRYQEYSFSSKRRATLSEDALSLLDDEFNEIKRVLERRGSLLDDMSLSTYPCTDHTAPNSTQLHAQHRRLHNSRPILGTYLPDGR